MASNRAGLVIPGENEIQQPDGSEGPAAAAELPAAESPPIPPPEPNSEVEPWEKRLQDLQDQMTSDNQALRNQLARLTSSLKRRRKARPEKASPPAPADPGPEPEPTPEPATESPRRRRPRKIPLRWPSRRAT